MCSFEACSRILYISGVRQTATHCSTKTANRIIYDITPPLYLLLILIYYYRYSIHQHYNHVLTFLFQVYIGILEKRENKKMKHPMCPIWTIIYIIMDIIRCGPLTPPSFEETPSLCCCCCCCCCCFAFVVVGRCCCCVRHKLLSRKNTASYQRVGNVPIAPFLCKGD